MHAIRLLTALALGLWAAPALAHDGPEPHGKKAGNTAQLEKEAEQAEKRAEEARAKADRAKEAEEARAEADEAEAEAERAAAAVEQGGEQRTAGPSADGDKYESNQILDFGEPGSWNLLDFGDPPSNQMLGRDPNEDRDPADANQVEPEE